MRPINHLRPFVVSLFLATAVPCATVATLERAQAAEGGKRQPTPLDLDAVELRAAASEVFQAIPALVPTVKGNPVTREKVESRAHALVRMAPFGQRRHQLQLLS